MSKPSVRSLIEILEARAVPAVLIGVGGQTATFTDVDGDAVTVTVSAGTLTPANFTTDASGAGEQLQLINLSGGGFDGANLVVTAAKGPAGDGRVNVGYINSLGHDLGVVRVNGDLGQIMAGDASAAQPGVARLTVDSLGRLGSDTQEAGGDVRSTVERGLGALVVRGDFAGATLFVPGSALGTVKIGGSVIGGEVIGTGQITAGTIGSVQIGGDLRGGSGDYTGYIGASGIGSIRIGGSVIGSAGFGSGLIELAQGDLGALSIGHSLVGGTAERSGSVIVILGDLENARVWQDVVGGAGKLSGMIQTTDGDLLRLAIGGSVIGGNGDASGVVSGGEFGLVRIAHDLLGGAGTGSGRIVANGDALGITILGSLVGGVGGSSGRIVTGGDIFALRIGHDLRGGSAPEAGSVEAFKIGSARIGGSLIGGSANSTGFVSTGTDGMDLISIGGSVLGGTAPNTGYIYSDGELDVVRIARDLQGSTGTLSGQIKAEKIGTVVVGGSVLGGSGNSSGLIDSDDGGIGRARIGGSVIGGPGQGFFTGGIQSDGGLGVVRIGRDLIGGSISGTDGPVIGSGYVQSNGGRIGRVVVGGSIISGVDSSTVGFLAQNASIRADDDLGALVVRGSLVGHTNVNGDTPVVITANGQVIHGTTTDVAIGRIVIGGSVEFSRILAGYSPSLAPVNADAQIGAVKVGGSWTASSLVAGVEDAGADGFGNFLDAAIGGGSANIVSRIASITIGRVALGTPESLVPGDHFGFVAQQVGAATIGGRAFALTAGKDSFLAGPTNDLRIREVL